MTACESRDDFKLQNGKKHWLESNFAILNV